MKLKLNKEMSNQEVAKLLEFIAEVLEAQGADRFRVRAYQNAAASIESYPKQMKKIYDEGEEFEKVPALGEAMANKLNELYETGNVESLQEYVSEVPAGVRSLIQLHGVGGKTALRLAKEFELDDEETAYQKLLAAAESGQIRELEGFAEKSEEDLIRRLKMQADKKDERMPYKKAKPKADKIIEQLIKLNEVHRIEALGSIRRHAETVGDIDLGLVVNNIGPVKKHMKNMENVKRYLVSGEKLFRVLLDDDTQVDLKLSPADEWGSFLQHFTGSKEHNIKLREYALDKNMSLSEHGIKVLDSDTKEPKKKLKFAEEEEFYHALDLKWIPPEERIGKDEIKRYKQANH